jgi:hypothetical protein
MAQGKVRLRRYVCLWGASERRQDKKRKDSAGSDDTASMIKGGGYIGARTRQPPTVQTIEKDLIWVRGLRAVAPRSTP